jgi:hypothetical protein
MNPKDSVISQLEPETKMNHQVVLDYIRYACYHYMPSKPTKKKMKQLIESIPFFLPEEKQDSFYKLIRKYPIECYWDTRESMQEYGYLLYSTYAIKERTRVKTKKEYMEDLYTPPNTYQQKHSLLFFLVIILLFYFLYRIK